MEKIDMSGEAPYVCYHWRFSTQSLNKRGRRYKYHSVTVLGSDYSNANNAMKQLLKKRGWTLEKINYVVVEGISFAFHRTEGYPWIESERFKDLPMPVIPEIL